MADLDAEFAKFQAELFETEMAAMAEQQPAEVRSALLFLCLPLALEPSCACD
jgi:hypothetical protein